MSGPSLHPRPFALPEYGYAVAKFVHDGVSRLMEAKDEVWGMIPRAEPSETIPITQNTMPSGDVVQSNPVVMQAKFILSYEDIRSCNVDELAAQMDSAADQNLAVVMPHFFDLVSRTSQAAGTATDCGGKPFSFELYLASLEKIDIAFDEKGNPELPSLIVSPEFAERLNAMPPFTSDQKKLLDDLIEKKRREYNARRRSRNLR
jgi:hypothetical protein